MLLEEARELIKDKKIRTPKYNPQKWKKYIGAGCYPYALNIHTGKFFLVGELIGKRCTYNVSDEYLLDVLIEELNALGFKVRSCKVEEKTCKNEMKIYLQREEHTGGYHFLREDSDGKWSHKYPCEFPIRHDCKKNLIKNPEEMAGKFYGWCFILRKNE